MNCDWRCEPWAVESQEQVEDCASFLPSGSRSAGTGSFRRWAARSLPHRIRVACLVGGFWAAMVATAPGQPPGGMFRFFVPDQQAATTSLLRMDEVRAELKIDDAQRQKIDELLNAYDEAERTAREQFDFPALMDLEEDERQGKLAEFREQVSERAKPTEQKLEAVLNDAQRERLGQLRLQRAGVSAWSRAEIADKLQLNETQRAKFAVLQPKLNPALAGPPRGPGAGGGDGRGDGPPDFPGPPDFNQIEEDRRAATKQALALLDENQRQVWKSLQGKAFEFPEMMFGGPPGGPMGGPMGGPELELVKKFDRDGNGWLNQDERAAARVEAKQQAANRPEGPGGRGGRRRGPAGDGGPGFGPPPGGGGPPNGDGPPGFGPPGGGRAERGGRGGAGMGPPGGMRAERPPAKPGQHLAPADVQNYPQAPLYDPGVLRTLFFEFENEDWEAELADFKNTDVEVPARMTVDGQSFANVGVSFRGASSYFMTPAGYKRSLNVALDLANPEQRLYGYRTLNLLNSNEDASLMHSVLYSRIANEYLPAPKANLVRVVINGEDWGVYQNAQQFNKEFLAEHFPSTNGARWKVPGSPGGGGSLAYLGDDVARYRRLYEIKSADKAESWERLIQLCKVLNETPADQLPAAIEPILDVDGVLRFLALDVVLINSDGYWTRASDYNLFCDEQGKFHVIPHDMNESFQPPLGPGMGRGRGENTGPFALDPLVGLTDRSKPLRSKLLAVPEYRQRYLQYVRQIADRSLDWQQIGPFVAATRALIAEAVAADTRKLVTTEAFERATAAEPSEPPAQGEGRGRRPELSLRAFFDGRRAYLLEHEQVRAAQPLQ